MRLASRDLPEVGELVIGTVKRIAEHGIYVQLDEYDLEAFAPTQEVIQSWFHNVRDYVKEGNKTVFKVISVNPKMKVVEVSLRRVRHDEKEKKMLQYRHRVRAVRLLEIALRRLGRDPAQAVQLMWALEEHFGDPYRAFEEAAKVGPQALADLELDADLKAQLAELARQQIELPPTRISGIIKAVSIEGDGAERIRTVLEELSRALSEKYPQVSHRIYVVGPPRYRIDLVGQNPKQVEAAFGEVASFLQAAQQRRKVLASLQRLE